jgi:hypothetical protein
VLVPGNRARRLSAYRFDLLHKNIHRAHYKNCGISERVPEYGISPQVGLPDKCLLCVRAHRSGARTRPHARAEEWRTGGTRTPDLLVRSQSRVPPVPLAFTPQARHGGPAPTLLGSTSGRVGFDLAFFLVRLAAARTVQPALLPFTPQFLPFPAYYLANSHWHAMLFCVCQSPRSPIH